MEKTPEAPLLELPLEVQDIVKVEQRVMPPLYVPRRPRYDSPLGGNMRPQFDRNDDFLVVRTKRIAGVICEAGKPFDKSLVSTRLLRQLYEGRWLRLASNNGHKAVPTKVAALTPAQTEPAPNPTVITASAIANAITVPIAPIDNEVQATKPDFEDLTAPELREWLAKHGVTLPQRTGGPKLLQIAEAKWQELTNVLAP